MDQRELGGGDVVGCRVEARVSWHEEAGDGLTGSAWSMVEEGHQRVMGLGVPPGRGRVLLVGVGIHEDTVEIDCDLAVGVEGSLPANDRARARNSDRADRLACRALLDSRPPTSAPRPQRQQRGFAGRRGVSPSDPSRSTEPAGPGLCPGGADRRRSREGWRCGRLNGVISQSSLVVEQVETGAGRAAHPDS
ncbi:hypothetical protein STAN_3877 [Streptomyces sp. CBMAI 2042]|nr:hypothetical protein STAN_3877 [Streptomyces sp. CBMAI 2042]